MRAGDLDRRIAIEQPTPATNATGEEITGWTPFHSVWARFTPTGGSESFGADQRTAVQRVTFEIRYRTGITTQMSVLFQGRRYQIEDVANSERGVNLLLTCHVLDAGS